MNYLFLLFADSKIWSVVYSQAESDLLRIGLWGEVVCTLSHHLPDVVFIVSQPGKEF